MVINYEWINGIGSRCPCGRSGTWFWMGTAGFIVDHGGDEACEHEQLTRFQERELRRNKGSRERRENRPLRYEK